MSYIRSSPKRIDEVSSDDSAIGFDLVSHLSYMSVLFTGDLPRDQVLEQCSRQSLKTAVYFEYIYILAKRIGLEYSLAFQLVAERARAVSARSLFRRFAASLSSGESEREFVIQETRVEGERYANQYERNVENLRKWTDAYAAILVSVTLVMVISLVSSMMGSLSTSFIFITTLTLLCITSIGVYIIHKVAPVERKTYDSPRGVCKERRLARSFLLLVPVGIVLAVLLAPKFGLLSGSSVAFLLIGVSLLPAGFYSWKDDANVTQLDSGFATFLRNLGNVAGSTGLTLTEAMKRIDTRAMGALEPYINRLGVRLSAQLPTRVCWDKFREETGSELVNRTTHMLVDGSELAGRPAEAGQICSSFAQTVIQLRAKRQLTAAAFSFLTIPMHATMTFILVFVLEIISSFSSRLATASGELAGNAGGADAPDRLTSSAGVSVPDVGDLAGGLDIFGTQDTTLTSVVIITVITILTVANSVAPKFATGGSNLKIASYGSMMCIVSGVILGVVPILTGKLFSVG